jgi:hypothetical protein
MGGRGPSSDEQLLDVYGDQAALLADAGVDLIMLEMFDARWSAALRTALDTGLPVWVGVWTRVGDDGGLLAPTGRAFEEDGPPATVRAGRSAGRGLDAPGPECRRWRAASPLRPYRDPSSYGPYRRIPDLIEL